MLYGGVRDSASQAVVTLVTITEMGSADAGVLIVMNPLHDRHASRLCNSDHRWADQRGDIVQVDYIGALLLQYSPEPPHARGRVQKTECRIGHLEATAVDDGVVFFQHRNNVNPCIAQQRNLIVHIPVLTGWDI